MSQNQVFIFTDLEQPRNRRPLLLWPAERQRAPAQKSNTRPSGHFTMAGKWQSSGMLVFWNVQTSSKPWSKINGSGPCQVRQDFKGNFKFIFLRTATVGFLCCLNWRLAILAASLKLKICLVLAFLAGGSSWHVLDATRYEKSELLLLLFRHVQALRRLFLWALFWWHQMYKTQAYFEKRLCAANSIEKAMTTHLICCVFNM